MPDPEGTSNSMEAALHQRIAALEADNAKLAKELTEANGMIRMFRDIGQNLELFSISFKESQISLAALAAVMKEEQRNALDSSGVSTMARTAIDRIGQTLENNTSACHMAASMVAGLTDKAARIIHIIQMLRNCSSKVDALAFHASNGNPQEKQASAAAPQLADELCKLSALAGQTVDEITAVAHNIQGETTAARQAMERLAEQSAVITRESTSATQSIQNLLDLTQRLEAATSSSALRSFVELAKIDHLIYKFEIYRVFFGLSDKAPRDLPDYNSCRLGKWYYQGGGVECFSRLDGYAEMDLPHQQVHKFAEEALEAYHGGKFENGVAALARMEHASREVIMCLEKIALAGEQQPEALCML